MNTQKLLEMKVGEKIKNIDWNQHYTSVVSLKSRLKKEGKGVWSASSQLGSGKFDLKRLK